MYDMLRAIVKDEQIETVYTPDADAALLAELHSLGVTVVQQGHSWQTFDMALAMLPANARALMVHSELIVVCPPLTATRFGDLAAAFAEKSYVSDPSYTGTAVFRRVPRSEVMRHYAEAIWHLQQGQDEAALMDDVAHELAETRQMIDQELDALHRAYADQFRAQAQEIAQLRYALNAARTLPGYRLLAGLQALDARLFPPQSGLGRLRGKVLRAVSIIRAEGAAGVMRRLQGRLLLRRG